MVKSLQNLFLLIETPSPFIEQPQRVTIPLEIRTYPRVPTTTVQILEKPRQWVYGKPEPTILPMGRKFNVNVCQWYRRKKAIRQLARYHKSEKKRALQERIERERRDMEHKALEHFKLQAKKKQYEAITSPSHQLFPPKKTLMDRYHDKEREKIKKKSLEKERKEIEKQALNNFKAQQQHPATYKEKKRAERSIEEERKELEKQALKQFKAQQQPTTYKEEKRAKRNKEKERKELEKQALEHFKAQQQPTTYKEEKRADRNIEKERKELEKQALEHFKLEETYKPKKVKLEEYKTKKIKTKKIKMAKKSYAKPKTVTRAVTEKRLSRYDDIGVRFTNCFYRFCCQLYCCVTCFLIIGFVVIVIL